MSEMKTKTERLQAILRLIQEYPISRQETLLEHLRQEGFAVTQATIFSGYPRVVLGQGSNRRGIPLRIQPDRGI